MQMSERRMKRPPIERVLMRIAESWALRSTCSRLQVGAVAARDGRVVVSGYNGAVKHAPHCVHVDYTPCDVSVHAEANLVAFAAREGIRLDGTDVFTTHSPCLACARLLVNAGVRAVTFGQEYRSTEGLRLLSAQGVLVHTEVGE